MAEKKLTGKITRERIRLIETPFSPKGVIEGFRALGDASGIVSEVMDELGTECDNQSPVAEFGFSGSHRTRWSARRK